MDKLIVRGTEVNIQWNVERDDYISLTDIAKVKDSDNPRYIIQNWMRNRKEPVKNIDMWKRLLATMEPHKVTFHWVKGHAGHPENERCDSLAVEAALQENLPEDAGMASA